MGMKRLFITLSIGAVVILAGCGKSSAPTEAMIKEDIVEHQNEYLDNNLYFYTDTGYIWGETEIKRDMEVSSLKIQKSRTEDTSYTAWCDVSFENDSYKDNCVIVVSYNKGSYPSGHYHIDWDYEESNEDTAIIWECWPTGFQGKYIVDLNTGECYEQGPYWSPDEPLDEVPKLSYWGNLKNLN